MSHLYHTPPSSACKSGLGRHLRRAPKPPHKTGNGTGEARNAAVQIGINVLQPGQSGNSSADGKTFADVRAAARERTQKAIDTLASVLTDSKAPRRCISAAVVLV
jgi:hypothetical protein